MKGGEFLGNGTYGCMFAPSLKCVNDYFPNQTDDVGKVFSDMDNFNEEYEMSLRVTKNVDPEGELTNKLIKACYPDGSSAEMRKCPLRSRSNNLYQLIYKDKGIDLNGYYKRNKQYNVEDTIKFMYNLLLGIQLLNKNNLAHMDLKEDNTLVTDKNKRLIMIDFGLSRELNKVYTSDIEHIHDHYYQFYPQEFKVYSALIQFVKDKKKWKALLQGTLTFNSFKTKIDRYVQNIYKAFKDRLVEEGQISENVNIPQFSEYGWYDPLKRVRRSDIETQYNTFIRTLYDKLYLVHKKKLTIPIVNAYFTEQFAGKLDVFSAGVIMLNNLKHANNTKFLNSELRQNYLGIIRDAINFNPYERDTIQNLVKRFKKGVLPYQTPAETLLVEKPANAKAETPKTSTTAKAETPKKRPKTPKSSNPTAKAETPKTRVETSSKSKISDKEQFIARCKANHTKEQIQALMKKNGIKSRNRYGRVVYRFDAVCFLARVNDFELKTRVCIVFYFFIIKIWRLKQQRSFLPINGFI